MVYNDSDPNWLLFEIVNTSISTANSLIAKGIDEAKNLIDNAVQKMFEFEKSGVVIEADVLFQKAKLFFFYEGARPPLRVKERRQNTTMLCWSLKVWTCQQAKLIYCRSSNANRNGRIR